MYKKKSKGSGYTLHRMVSAFNNAAEVNIDDYPGFVIMSDCHRGTGTWADNFLNNRPIYTAALKHYLQKDYCYIELGDGDELWENRRFDDIHNTHSEIFYLFSLFQEKNSLFLVYGNHDRVLSQYSRIESVIIKGGKLPIYLFHGYQGDLINDNFWKLSRWLVRYIWKPLELRGFRNPTSAAKNNKKMKKAENRFLKFSSFNKCTLVAGHTHRPTLMEQKPYGNYFNSGSCIHPNAITAIEITDGKAFLIKWSVCSQPDMSLYICREVIAGPVDV